VPTEAGEQLFARARRIIADTEDAWAAIRRLDDTPRGPLRVSTNMNTHAHALFTAFARDYPEVRLEVTVSDRHVDLVAEGIDVAIRGGEVTDPNVIARKLFTGRSVAVASPAYLEGKGAPESPDDLVHHDLIVGFRGASTPTESWPLLSGGEVRVRHRLASSQMRLQIECALAGLGITMAPRSLVAPEVEADRLQYVLESELGAPAPPSLVCTDREFQAPQVRAFIERATEFFLGRQPASSSAAGAAPRLAGRRGNVNEEPLVGELEVADNGLLQVEQSPE
jgi:DNA-binding transcriptional LysR family regulator